MTSTVAPFPTGEQYEIAHDDRRAVVVQIGAALRAYSVAGRDVVRGFAADEPITKGRGQHLLPWPNRLRDGRYTFDGTATQLPINEVANNNASHGLTRWLSWELVEHTAASVRQRVVLRPQPGWSWILEASITHSVGPDGLTVDVEAVNHSSTPCPFGYGAHPFFTVGEETIDDVELRVPGARILDLDDRSLPVAVRDVAAAEDLQDGGLLGDRRFDHAFTGLSTEDGRWRAELRRGERVASVWADGVFGWAQVFTGGPARDIGVAIEPMTCGPDAFNPGATHDDLIVLDPGERFAGSWGIEGR